MLIKLEINIEVNIPEPQNCDPDRYYILRRNEIEEAARMAIRGIHGSRVAGQQTCVVDVLDCDAAYI